MMKIKKMKIRMNQLNSLLLYRYLLEFLPIFTALVVSRLFQSLTLTMWFHQFPSKTPFVMVANLHNSIYHSLFYLFFLH